MRGVTTAYRDPDRCQHRAILVRMDRVGSPGAGRPTQERARRGGFTLLELIVVIIVLALLAGLVAPQIFGRLTEARGTTARTQIELLGTALDTYRLDNGAYPTTEQGLQALREKPVQAPVPGSWRGPYVRKAVPNDPWGRPYLYRCPGERNAAGYDLLTFGRDGQPGGAGEDADIGADS